MPEEAPMMRAVFIYCFAFPIIQRKPNRLKAGLHTLQGVVRRALEGSEFRL